MIDPMKLAMLPRDTPLKIYSSPSGFKCVICGVEAYAHAWRVKLPQRAGVACSTCAGDHGFDVR